MRVLLYNFAQLDEGAVFAGGVGVYLNSLVGTLLARGVDVVFLSSGVAYSPWSRRASLRSRRVAGVKRAKIINSPVIAPAGSSFFSPDVYLDSDALDDVPRKLKRLYGSFDVLHFHNIEGLTHGFFQALHREFASAKTIFTAHNYNIVCPQVNLWRKERVRCENFLEGQRCVRCVPFRDAKVYMRERAAGWLRDKLKGLPTIFNNAIHLMLQLPTSVLHTHGRPSQIASALADDFVRLREANIRLAASFDHVIAVSRRTRDVLVQQGLSPRNIEVLYIGSSHVDLKHRPEKAARRDRPLRVAYLGYARRDKGFFFLLDALEAMPLTLTESIELTLAARGLVGRTRRRVEALNRRFAQTRILDGYLPDQLEDILSTVDVGIVPPLWEDNLPQVAIEFVAHGVPILTSDLGGASEIASNPAFVFPAGSKSALHRLLSRIIDGDLCLSEFWQNGVTTRTLRCHVDELMVLYASPSSAARRSSRSRSNASCAPYDTGIRETAPHLARADT